MKSPPPSPKPATEVSTVKSPPPSKMFGGLKGGFFSQKTRNSPKKTASAAVETTAAAAAVAAPATAAAPAPASDEARAVDFDYRRASGGAPLAQLPEPDPEWESKVSRFR